MIQYGIARCTVLTFSVGRCVLPVHDIPKESFTGLNQLLVLQGVELPHIFPSPVIPVDIILNPKATNQDSPQDRVCWSCKHHIRGRGFSGIRVLMCHPFLRVAHLGGLGWRDLDSLSFSRDLCQRIWSSGDLLSSIPCLSKIRLNKLVLNS